MDDNKTKNYVDKAKDFLMAYDTEIACFIFGFGCGALTVYRRIEKGIDGFLKGVTKFLNE